MAGLSEKAGSVLRGCVRAATWALDGLDVLCGRMKRAAFGVVFRGGETPARRLARPVRRALSRTASRWAELFFRPDETIVPDPLRPSARVVAAGLGQAFRRAEASRGGAFRVLVCRVPGSRIGIRFDATRRRCSVDVFPPPAGAPAHAEAALPPFAPGAAPAAFRVADDNLRLVLRATPAGVAPVSPR